MTPVQSQAARDAAHCRRLARDEERLAQIGDWAHGVACVRMVQLFFLDNPSRQAGAVFLTSTTASTAQMSAPSAPATVTVGNPQAI